MPSSCLSCQKPLTALGHYHPRCLLRLFGSTRLPRIPFGKADLPRLIAKMESRMSIPGVQMKASVRLNKETWELEPAVTGGTHILKPDSERFPQIAQNENLCMTLAEELGLRVPPHGLFPMADAKLCYVVKRFDRAADGKKIQNETMYQLLESNDKYLGSLEGIGKAIRAYTANIGLDVIDFFERVLLCFLTGNGDMHLKNWALLGQGKDISLAPCYDHVSSRLYIKEDFDSALTINAKRNDINRADFEALAHSLRLDPRAAANSLDKLHQAQGKLCELAFSAELSLDLRQGLVSVITSRYARLFG